MPVRRPPVGWPDEPATAIVTDPGRLGEPLGSHPSGAHKRHHTAYAALPRGIEERRDGGPDHR
jgi:hypothetical protein